MTGVFTRKDVDHISIVTLLGVALAVAVGPAVIGEGGTLMSKLMTLVFQLPVLVAIPMSRVAARATGGSKVGPDGVPIGFHAFELATAAYVCVWAALVLAGLLLRGAEAADLLFIMRQSLHLFLILPAFGGWLYHFDRSKSKYRWLLIGTMLVACSFVTFVNYGSSIDRGFGLFHPGWVLFSAPIWGIAILFRAWAVRCIARPHCS